MKILRFNITKQKKKKKNRERDQYLDGLG